MLFPAAVSLALVAGASAQSTVSLFLPGFDSQSLVAQVVGSDATATTYSLGCASNVNSEDCGVPPGFTIAQGASTMNYVMSYGDQYISLGCNLKGDIADCSDSISPSPTDTGSDAAVTQTTVSGLSSYYQAVVITSGAASGAAATTGATPAATTAAATATPTNTSTGTDASSGFSTATSSSKKTSSASGTASEAHSSTSTGGVPMITGNAHWMVGGAAAALVLAAM